MKKIIYSILAIAAFTTTFTACKKDPVTDPVVVEEELITTMKLTVTDSGNVSRSFVYKVQNGFGSSTQGTVVIDTVKLAPGYTYNYSLQVLNESEDPAEDITEEVLTEKEAHLFFLASNPASGAGSITKSNGSLDNNNLPFNQSGKLTTGTAGSGSFTITLIHEPVNKSAGTAADAAGSTDAEAIFPVLVQ
jgi:hypothetical protein